MTLRIDWATHDAARFACEKWHYSKCLPTGKLVKVGAWEDDEFIGVVIFSRGASPFLFHKFDIPQTAGCELTRVALRKHATPVSRIMAIAFKFLKKKCPELRLIVSFADPKEGHHGGIYQATNWVYTGRSNPTTEVYVGGSWRHMRGAFYQMNEKTPTREVPGKHRYLMPLDEEMRFYAELIKLPYPKRAGSKVAVALADQARGGGAEPTSALQTLRGRERAVNGK